MTPREVEDRLLVAGLKQLTADVQSTGVTLMLEPLTQKETHYMNLQCHGAQIVEAVGRPASGCSAISSTCKWRNKTSPRRWPKPAVTRSTFIWPMA